MAIGQYIFARDTDGLTRDSAAALATSLGGTLAAVTDLAEHQLFLDILARDGFLFAVEPRDDARNGPWIGLLQPAGSVEPGGGWTWDTGEAFAFTAWHAGQPDNFIGDTVAIYWDDNGSIGWADHVNDPVGAGFGPVISAAVEIAATTRLLRGTADHDFIWAGGINNTVRSGGGDDIVDGNDGRDRLIGGNGADELNGGRHADRLDGGRGRDSLDGGFGDDILIGNGGGDTMTGSGGADIFVFDAGDSGRAAQARDRVTDFDAAEGDLLDFSGIDAIPGGADDPLTFRNQAAFTGTGQIRIEVAGANTLVQVNLTGDATPEMVIVLTGAIDLTRDDFVL